MCTIIIKKNLLMIGEKKSIEQSVSFVRNFHRCQNFTLRWAKDVQIHYLHKCTRCVCFLHHLFWWLMMLTWAHPIIAADLPASHSCCNSPTNGSYKGAGIKGSDVCQENIPYTITSPESSSFIDTRWVWCMVSCCRCQILTSSFCNQKQKMSHS